eukprot:scaffold3824_cov95-Pinguiococcus_pyrenoidosus.AAC.1
MRLLSFHWILSFPLSILGDVELVLVSGRDTSKKRLRATRPRVCHRFPSREAGRPLWESALCARWK